MPDMLQQVIQAVSAGLALGTGPTEDSTMTWVYRLIIAVLLSVLSTLFVLERFLPYPWEKDKAQVITDIRVLQSDIRKIERLESRIEELRQENLRIHSHDGG